MYLEPDRKTKFPDAIPHSREPVTGGYFPEDTAYEVLS
jgi:hypothetical protein